MTGRDQAPPIPRAITAPRRRTGRLHQQIEIGATRRAAVQRVIRQKIEKAHDLGLDIGPAGGRRQAPRGGPARRRGRWRGRTHSGGAARRRPSRAAG